MKTSKRHPIAVIKSVALGLCRPEDGVCGEDDLSCRLSRRSHPDPALPALGADEIPRRIAPQSDLAHDGLGTKVIGSGKA